MPREGFILLMYADWRDYPDYEPFTDGGIWLNEDAIKAEVAKRNAEHLESTLKTLNHRQQAMHEVRLQAYREREALVMAGLRTESLPEPVAPEPITEPGRYYKAAWSYEGGLDVHE